ncbi:MAG TPA: GlxA family transcriptional regulator [Sphingomicrobium sp.]|nr:GlxA family transcriptional regulator [Sphingomicrobium sp.]
MAKPVASDPKRIGFLAFDGVTLLDLVGPFEVFATANQLSGEALYQTCLIGEVRRPIRADSGFSFHAQLPLDEAGSFDTIVIPGGPGLRVKETNATVAAWLKVHAPETRRIVSVCTGLYGVAAAGLLDGRTATTHWNHAEDAARRFPKVRMDAARLYHEDPPFFTSAGITAGIDLCLALVEQDHGSALALDVAREMVVYLKRPGDQLQYSEPLRFQVRSIGRLQRLADWIPGHLPENLSVASLAARAGMGARHFARVFRDTFGETPARYVETLRLEQARERLLQSGRSIESIADSVGYRSADVFRRAFERRYGVSPAHYVRTFARR